MCRPEAIGMLLAVTTLLLSVGAAADGSSSDDAQDAQAPQTEAPPGVGAVHNPVVLGGTDPLPFRVMPLGDSISICCNYCAVPAGVLTRKDLHEPPTPWDGYIRPLWLKLKAEEQRQQLGPLPMQGGVVAAHDQPAPSRFRFSYVGRVVTCMVNRSDTMRVPDDWEIRYEGYYGYTTGRVLQEIVGPALAANDPDVVLLMLGTNDLIQAKAGGRLGRVGTAIQNLKKLIELLLTTPRKDASTRSRHVFVGKIPPIWFNQIKAVAPAARKPHRVLSLNREIDKMVEGMVGAQRARFQQLQAVDPSHSNGGTAPPAFLPTITAVDMFFNMSVYLDLHGDGLHPNANGEAKISAQWFRALGPLMAAPGAHHAVSMVQNDDGLLEAYLDQRHANAGGRASVAPTGKWAVRKAHVVLDQPAALFAEQPTHWDGALFPVIVLTIVVYGALVCRPTQRMLRVGYAWAAAQYNRWSRSRAAVA